MSKELGALETNIQNDAHPELHALRSHLQHILEDMSRYAPVIFKPPILDSSYDSAKESGQESVPGIRALRDAIKQDLEVLEKFLADPKSVSLPPLSTNAPYLIAVWHEVLLAPPPITAIWRTYNDNAPQGDPIGANSRMLAEFREIDSYLTDSSEGSDDPDTPPTLAQTEFDNSLLKIGRALLSAAAQNPLPGTNVPPIVNLRLTRLDPAPENSKEHDPRIAQTIDTLRAMGIDVQLGERDAIAIPQVAAPPPPHRLEPTLRINLDLSILIALVSDITHAPPPHSAAEADARYEPPPEYREWKKKRNGVLKGPDFDGSEEGIGKHARALATQALQEAKRGLIQEMHDRLCALVPQPVDASGRHACPPVEFWTTPDARDRFLRIVLSKIGGPAEQRRALALFPDHASPPLSIEEAEEAYWRGSRYPRGFLPLLPVRMFPATEPDAALEPPADADGCLLSPFFHHLACACRRVLALETIPDLREASGAGGDGEADGQGDTDGQGDADADVIPRAAVTRANPRLTAHTMQSVLWGAVRRWTTLTANKTSVKAILRETGSAGGSNEYGSGPTDGLEDASGMLAEKAALWVVDPRSLAEGRKRTVPTDRGRRVETVVIPA
ncbi:predicted protein [Postia placenta Mad-698-R]|nr:predicted protein [Postia placenta Mad-698-R]